MDYNVIVIGAGSAGLVSSYICAALKAKILLIEKHRMGGDCLNTGCVPSKALIRTTSLLSQIQRHREFGIAHAEARFDFAEIMDRIHRVIRKVEPHDSVNRYRSLGVDCELGEAKLISPHEVRVNGKEVTSRAIILATGATPAIPPIPGLNETGFLHTDNIWEIRKQPRRLGVIGGGPIGSELGQCFARLGTQVTIIQTAPQLLNREDDEVVRIMEKRFREEGIVLHLNAKPLEVSKRNGAKVIAIEEGGMRKEVVCDEVLVAVGRQPRVNGFGLEALGIRLTERGSIAIDAYSRTSIKNIFACGDCASPYQFTHWASHQAWYCAVNALFQPLKKFKIDYRFIPWCTYTDPEIARVGLNEKDAKRKGIPYEVTTYPLEDLDRAIADEEDHGLVKVLTEPRKDRILGVTICGYHAGDILPEFIATMKNHGGLNAILNTIHVYPTMAEANKYAAGAWKKAHAPKGLLKLLEVFHSLRRR